MVKTKIFLDGADAILENANNPDIAGFTTNPTLMKKAGVVSYEAFARQVLQKITDKPVAFEVLSDDFAEMHKQAFEISSWGNNVNVKIPVTNTKGESSVTLIGALLRKDICVNITAITTIKQIFNLLPLFNKHSRGYVSIFAGRIADTGQDPTHTIRAAQYLLSDFPGIKLIWASAREIYNVRQADDCGCDIITIGMDLYKKLPLLGMDLNEMSLNTVKMFHDDGKSFKIN